MNPIEEAKEVFQELKRWTAFYEIEQQIGPIMDHWLTIGANVVRQHFDESPCGAWKCASWGNAMDTRWYLSGDGLPGEKGICIGIGWREFELHLFHGGLDPEVRDRALALLQSPEFEPLRSLTGSQEYRADRRREGSILSVRDFNPFDEISDSGLRPRVIAWHAARANENPTFITKVSTRIRQIIENPEIVRLISELDRQASLNPSPQS